MEAQSSFARASDIFGQGKGRREGAREGLMTE